MPTPAWMVCISSSLRADGPPPRPEPPPPTLPSDGGIGGGGEGFAVSFWGAGYVHAIQLATLVAAILGNLPLIGPLITLFVYLAIEVWTALQLTTIARVRHHLTPQRATLAGWTPFLVFSAIGVGCCALMVLWFVSTPMWPDQ